MHTVSAIRGVKIAALLLQVCAHPPLCVWDVTREGSAIGHIIKNHFLFDYAIMGDYDYAIKVASVLSAKVEDAPRLRDCWEPEMTAIIKAISPKASSW